MQPSASATVLNKVLGLNPSLINGALEANGKVILINPQGVIVGKGGIIRTADFIASTLDRISSTAEGMEFTGDSTASIVNYGTIKTAFGDVVLIATTVNNSGTSKRPSAKSSSARGPMSSSPLLRKKGFLSALLFLAAQLKTMAFSPRLKSP